MKIAYLVVLILTSVGLALMPSTTVAGGRAAGGGVVVAAPHGSVIVTSPSAVVVHAAPKIFVGTPLVHPHPFVTRPFSPFGVFATPVFAQPAPSVFPTPLDPWRFWPPGTAVPRLFFGSSFFRFGHSFFPSITSAPVTGVYTSPVYASTPIYYSQPAPVPVPAPAPLPTPTVIEYPTGWYQLRGDGLSTPYVWVWIPKPPSPPSAVPPTVPPAAPPRPQPAPPAQEQPSMPRSPLYRWTDAQEVEHWTDRLDRVPERYRSKVQRQA